MKIGSCPALIVQVLFLTGLITAPALAQRGLSDSEYRELKGHVYEAMAAMAASQDKTRTAAQPVFRTALRASLATGDAVTPAGASRSTTALYTGLQPSGSNAFWQFGLPAIGPVLDDGQMSAAATAVGGGHVTAYQFSFGLRADVGPDTLAASVIVSFYNAPSDPVAGATNPVVEPPSPVSSIIWDFNPITLPTAGTYPITSPVLDLVADGLDFNLDDSYYVEILALKRDGTTLLFDPNVHVMFNGEPTVTVGANQDAMWLDFDDLLYQNPAELFGSLGAGFESQVGINLIGLECTGQPELALEVVTPFDACLQPSEPLTVLLSMSCIPEPVRGYQAFLSFDETRLTFSSGSYLTPLPFGLPVIAPITAGLGEIDVAAGVDDQIPQPLPTGSADLALLDFVAGPLQGATTVGFRVNDPPTRFSDANADELLPVLTKTGTILVDGTPPVITCPPLAKIECDESRDPSNTGSATATDNLDPAPVITFVDDESGLTGCNDTGDLIRTWTATDCAGNASSCMQTIEITDTVPPTATGPNSVDLECSSDLPAPVTTIGDYLALPGTDANDNCTDQADLTVTSVDGGLVGDECAGSITRTYTIADACLLEFDAYHVFTVTDDTDPMVTCPADAIVECDASTAPANTGSATATDNCDASPAISFGDSVAAGACPQEQFITRTWTAEDDCGNTDTCDQTITVVDTTDPVITCPADITVNADAGGCFATVDPGMATATDNCDGAPAITWVRSDGKTNLTDPYDIADSPITITWTATDACGNDVDCVQTITVNAVNEMEVVIELSPNIDTGTTPDTLTRCITFELWGCPGAAPVVVQPETLTFDVTNPGSGPNDAIATATIEIPCGAYTCVTARDPLHTLRRTLDAPAFTINPTTKRYEADFVAAGKPLIGGNLNDDFFIDILDFGVFSSQFTVTYGTGDTTCATGFPHADISGDGLVDNGDFSFIQQNFLAISDANCCGAPLVRGVGDPQPVTTISVAELRRRGLGHLAGADLNRDGVLDQFDIVAYLNGARPAAPSGKWPAAKPLETQNVLSGPRK
jgi:hypothetical protein